MAHKRSADLHHGSKCSRLIYLIKPPVGRRLPVTWLGPSLSMERPMYVASGGKLSSN